jgi:hypothetical protein
MELTAKEMQMEFDKDHPHSQRIEELKKMLEIMEYTQKEMNLDENHPHFITRMEIKAKLKKEENDK